MTRLTSQGCPVQGGSSWYSYTARKSNISPKITSGGLITIGGAVQCAGNVFDRGRLYPLCLAYINFPSIFSNFFPFRSVFAYILFIFGLLLLDKVPLHNWCGWILAVPGRVMSPHIYVCNTKSRLTPDTDPISTLTNQGNLYPQRTQAMSYCVRSTLGGIPSRVYACIFIIITIK